MDTFIKNAIPFELKGSLFTLTVLYLFNPDPKAFTTQLRYHAQKTPNLFKNMPLVIDLQRLENPEDEIDFPALQHHLREYGLIPVGIRNGNAQQNLVAQAAGLAILSNQPTKAKPEPVSRKAAASAIAAPSALVIDKPVRSGQQIYARNTNLIVLAPVSHGSELLADGSIHVYDSLRGRALAGINGDPNTHIFCHKLEAELVSIAGHYRLSESLPNIDAPMIHIYLANEKVHIEGLPS